ncbi:MAG TPA: hypothetical protein DCM08_14230, partial [Microscillaceae bacterium]|nr:hypothetical protein [Microscillaceae bacterium]
GGATWNKITPSNISSEIGRISVDVFDAASEVLYATVEAKSKEDRGLYRSTDAGSNWERINGKEFGVNVRPFYFARTLIDPKNDSILYKVGLNLVVSKDQGRTFRAVGSGVHSDIHAVWVNPNNTEHVVIGTDGGVFVSFDRAYNFYMLKNLPVSQFYHVAVDDQTPYNVYGGLQDNGSWVGPSQSANGIENRDWVNVGGGDGFWVLPYPKDPNIIFCEYQGGNLMRHDRRTGQNKQVKPYTEPGQPKLRFNWNSPMHISATNPDRFYYGSQFLHVSYDKGDSWQTISPDLTTNDPQRQRQAQSGGVTIDNSSAENNTTIFTIAESPKDEKLIWVGTDDGNLQVSENGGGNWVNVVGNIPNLPKNTWCSKVEPSSFERNTIYATFDGHRAGDKKPYIYKSTDLGKTWVSLVTEDLKGFVHVIKEDLVNPNLLFAGTEFGLFISVDGGQNWAQFTNNMPTVPVNDVVIHPRENALLMATHGRGIVVVDDISALRQVTTEVLEKPIHIFEMPPVVLRGNASFQEYGGGGEFVGENPKEVALITYYLKKRHTFGDLDVEVYNEKGELLKKMPGGKSAGINMVEWATRLKGAKAAPTNNTQAIGGSIAGVSLPEGKYTVKIKKDEEIFTGTIELVADPNSVHSADDRRVQSEAAMQLYNMTEQVAYLYNTADDIQKQAEKAAEAGGKAAKDLNALAKTLKDYKNSLVDAEGDGYIDTKERIREEISELYGAINGYAGKPSQSQLDKLAGLAQDLGVKQNEFEKIKNGDLAKVNTKLSGDGGTALKVQTFEEFKAKE